VATAGDAPLRQSGVPVPPTTFYAANHAGSPPFPYRRRGRSTSGVGGLKTGPADSGQGDKNQSKLSACSSRMVSLPKFQYFTPWLPTVCSPAWALLPVCRRAHSVSHDHGDVVAADACRAVAKFSDLCLANARALCNAVHYAPYASVVSRASTICPRRPIRGRISGRRFGPRPIVEQFLVRGGEEERRQARVSSRPVVVLNSPRPEVVAAQ
jgi:hypothetical protein